MTKTILQRDTEGDPQQEFVTVTKDFYAQDFDPGAVGAGSVWKDTSAEPYLWWERNAANNGWDAGVVPTVIATGAAVANVATSATADAGTADASSSATSASGSAFAVSSATAGGAGNAEAGPSATSVDGIANAGPSASANGAGDATAGPTANAQGGNAHVEGSATVDTGVASAGSVAIRQGVTAGMQAVVDGTSARMAFNGTIPIAIPELPAIPTPEDIADALVALGLVTQAS